MFVHRVAISRQYRSAPTDVRRRWAFRDLIDAHMMLDAIELVEERQRRDR